MPQDPNQNLIIGRNAVLEALRSGREIDYILVVSTASGAHTAAIAKCKEKGIPVKEVASAKLDNICGTTKHQGIAAIIASHSYCEVSDILTLAESKKEPPFIVICDGIEDPHNLGAIIRTAEASGVHGIIIPKRRSASLTATVSKVASGALEYMKVARVTNLVSTINELKDKGLWIYGADMGGEPWTGKDYTGPCAIVVGSEGKGLSQLVKRNCDYIISIPMFGKINSLNASVAAGILMYEVARQRSVNA